MNPRKDYTSLIFYSINYLRTIETFVKSIKIPYVTNRRLIASDSSIEGNKRDCNMSGNQTSGKEGGVRCVMMVVCMYVCMYVCMLDIV